MKIQELLEINKTKGEVDFEELRNFLIGNEIQPSYHRLKILEFLVTNHVHPTVDTIFKNISKGIPTLSKTTIYNTLNLFIEKEITKPLTIEENEVRYDIKTHNHAHFKCINCGEIEDIEIQKEGICINGLDSKLIQEYHVYLKGLCEKCKQ